MNRWGYAGCVFMALVVVATACSPGDGDVGTTGASQEVAPPDVSAVSLALDIPERDVLGGYTFAPGFTGRLGGGGPALSDNGRVITYASVDATPSPTAQVVVGPIHGALPDLATVGLDGPSETESAFPVAISANGRFVLVHTAADDLVSDDTNGSQDLFRYDRLTGDHTRVSLDSFGLQIEGGIQPQADLSGDGNVAAFVTSGPTPDEPPMFVPDCRGSSTFIAIRDIAAGSTECVTVDIAGTPASGSGGWSTDPALNYDGRFVAFATTLALGPGDNNASVADIYVIDRETGLVERPSVGTDGEDPNGASSHPRLSADGRFVAYVSEASNLVPDDRNGAADVFVFDRLAGTTVRASVASEGQEGNAAAGDQIDLNWNGRFIAFSSDAENLTPEPCQIFLRDLALDTTECVDHETQGEEPTDTLSLRPSISADGRLVAFSSTETGWYFGGFSRVYVRDRGSVAAAVWPPDPGAVRPITFQSTAVLASVDPSGVPGNGNSGGAAASADGRWVAFWTQAGSLTGDPAGELRHIMLRDLAEGTSTLITSGADDHANRDHHRSVSLSDDGRILAFDSRAGNLVPGDTNADHDVFVFDRESGVLSRESVGRDGSELARGSWGPVLSADGSLVLFGGTNANVVPGVEWCGLVLRDIAGGLNSCLGLLPDGSRAAIDAWTLSGDGNTILFRSSSDDYVGEDSNGKGDLIAYDRNTDLYELISVASDGTQGDDEPGFEFAISDDGRTVAFVSRASTLVRDDDNAAKDVFLRDRDAGTTVRINTDPDGAESEHGDQGGLAVNSDGRTVVFPMRMLDDRGNAACDLVSLNRDTSKISCVPVSPTGEEWRGREPNISADFVAFSSVDPIDASVERGNGTQVYVRSLNGGGRSVFPEISDVPKLPSGMIGVPAGPVDGEPSTEQIQEIETIAGEAVSPAGETTALLQSVLGKPQLPEAENDRAEFEETLGPPDAFTVRYEHGIDGSTIVRYETWVYFDLLTAYEFVDGALTTYYPVTDPGIGAIGVPYHPLDFDRATKWTDVQGLLASPDDATPFEIPIEAGFVGTAYSAPQLLVMFDEQGLTHVEALPVTGGNDA